MNAYNLPLKPASLYMDRLRGKTIVYNPLAEKGILVVGEGAARILEFSNGSQDVLSIAKRMSLPFKDTHKIIKKLADYEVLYLSGHQPFSSPHKIGSRLRVWLHMTNACNLSCRYCYVRKDGRKMNVEIAHKLVDALHRSIAMRKDITTLRYILAGGEPFTNLDVVKEFLHYSQVQAQKFGLNRSIGIPSNGTILNSEIIALIKHHNAGISISIDGPSDMNRNRLFRNNRNSANIIFRNIDKLLKSGVRPYISITLAQENINGLVAFTKYLLERELDFSFDLVRDLKMMPSLIKYTDKVISILNECYDLMEITLPKCSRYINHKFESMSLPFGFHKYRGCGLGKYNFVISHDGKIFLCQMDMRRGREVATVEDEDIIGKLWTQAVYPELNEYKGVDNYDVCSLCCWRYQCGGSCPLFTKMVTGYFNRPSPYCAIYQKVIPRLIRIEALNFIAEQARRAYLSKGVSNYKA